LPGERYQPLVTPVLRDIIEEDLPGYGFEETLEFYDHVSEAYTRGQIGYADLAYLGCNDRYFLLTAVLQRKDALHPWLFDRCREVEANPDGHLDLWARYHYKSSIITFAGTIQDIVRDPDMTSAIISVNQSVARKFLAQIKQALETNVMLKEIYRDCLYEEPRKQSPKWSLDKGIVVIRSPDNTKKEATVEAIGLVEGLPAGPHFEKLLFDDAVTQKSVTNPEMIEKVSTQEEMADNIGIGINTRKQYVGTRYSVGDTYQQIIDRGDVKVRKHTTTKNGKLDGETVFLTQEAWERVKRTQRRVVAAQHLMNPAAGNEASFDALTFRPYTIRPSILNVYIIVDPSKGESNPQRRSDRTAMAVIGVDVNGNMYLLDGYRHRMKLNERWEKLHALYKKWFHMPGVQAVFVGYERYGLQSDIEHFEGEMQRSSVYLSFPIDELNWPRQGGGSKRDRVERLEPDFRNSNFYFPGVVWHPHYSDGNTRHCTWTVHPDSLEFEYKHMAGETRNMRAMRAQKQDWRIVKPIICHDEDDRVYDLTRVTLEELRMFPFGQHDDICDAISRIYDMEWTKPVVLESQALEVEDFPDA